MLDRSHAPAHTAVSLAGVVAACGYALLDGGFDPVAAVLCAAFAILAQVASNFANEYYDYTAGLDRADATGPAAASRKATSLRVPCCAPPTSPSDWLA